MENYLLRVLFIYQIQHEDTLSNCKWVEVQPLYFPMKTFQRLEHSEDLGQRDEDLKTKFEAVASTT